MIEDYLGACYNLSHIPGENVYPVDKDGEEENMDEVNKTLYIPLYGKSEVSKKKIIINDPYAEKIWAAEHFKVKGKAKSKWLTYNMAMRARIFDDWVCERLKENPDAVVLHIGCGLDSRFLRVTEKYQTWVDADFPEVIELRKKYYSENEHYMMHPFNAAEPEKFEEFPDGDCVIIVFEGISMYLKNEELNEFFKAAEKKYKKVLVLMDVYTVFGAKASKYKNPINDVGVTTVWGIDHVEDVLKDTAIKCKTEHSLTPKRLVEELIGFEKRFFKLMFTGSFYRKIYRLYELESE